MELFRVFLKLSVYEEAWVPEISGSKTSQIREDSLLDLCT